MCNSKITVPQSKIELLLDSANPSGIFPAQPAAYRILLVLQAK